MEITIQDKKNLIQSCLLVKFMFLLEKEIKTLHDKGGKKTTCVNITTGGNPFYEKTLAGSCKMHQKETESCSIMTPLMCTLSQHSMNKSGSSLHTDAAL